MVNSIDSSPGRRQRLLMVSGSFPDIPCGVSPHAERLCRLISHKNLYDVHLLTSDDPLVRADIAQGYTVHPEIRTWGVMHARSICRRIISLQPDIVHIQNLTGKYRQLRSGTMSVVAPLLKKMASNIRLVVTQHDIAIGAPLLRLRYYPLFRVCDAILVSNSRDEQAIRDQGISAGKIYRAPVSTHIQFRPPNTQISASVRQTLHIHPESTCVTYFGYIHPSRNIDILLQSLHLLQKRGRNVHGLIMGGPHAERACQKYFQRCRSLADTLGISDRVTWTGFADDQQVADGLAASDVFVSLIQRGADLRNSTILTGMFAQLPIITCRNERYYIDADLEKLGCVAITPRDPRALADAIEQIIETPSDAEFLARRAAFLDPQVIWNRHIDVIMAAYRGESPPAPASFGP